MARMLDTEYYKVSKNILDKIGDDSTFDSTGLTELTSDQSVVYLKNLKHEYSTKEVPKIRVVGRDRYPTKTFSTQSNFKNIKFSYLMGGIKQNWSQYEKGNGFLIAE